MAVFHRAKGVLCLTCNDIFMSEGLAENKNIRGNSEKKINKKTCFQYGSAAQKSLTAHRHGFG